MGQTEIETALLEMSNGRRMTDAGLKPDNLRSPYDFRKRNGIWQRRHKNDRNWSTLHIETVTPMGQPQKRPDGRPDTQPRPLPARQIWTWR